MDKLNLKLNDQIVEITQDDNGRYCLNDLYRASGSLEKKKPYRFLNDSKRDLKVVKTWEVVSEEYDKNGNIYTADFDNYVVQTKINRATKTFTSRSVFDRYSRFLGLVKIDESTYETDKLNVRKDKPNTLYVIKNDFGLTKIGITCNVGRRLKSIEMSSGVPCEKVLEFHIGDDAYDIEQDLHENFKEYRTVGEWFDFTKTDVNYLEFINELLKGKGVVND